MLFLGVALYLDDAVLDDVVDMNEADVAEDESDDDDDCDPRLLRLSSLLLSTRSCNVFLLSTCALVGGLLLDLDSDDTLAALLAILLILLLLFVRLRPLLPSAVELCIRALTDAEYARRASRADGRFSSATERGVKSLVEPTRCTFFSRARGVVRAAIPSLLELGDAVDVRPGVGILEILLGVRSFEPGTRSDVEMTRCDLPSIDCLSSGSSALVPSWSSDSAGYSGAGSSTSTSSVDSRPTASMGISLQSLVVLQGDENLLLFCSRYEPAGRN